MVYGFGFNHAVEALVNLLYRGQLLTGVLDFQIGFDQKLLKLIDSHPGARDMRVPSAHLALQCLLLLVHA